jgi:flavin-dependent dehydrogenase
MYWFKHGWFWVIPFRDGHVSVGAVCRPEYLKSRKVPTDQFLMQTIGLCPALADRMKSAVRVTEAMAAGNFSYYSKWMHDKNYLLIGDAFAFIDPVFSTGVFLAMSGARSAAEAIDVTLRNPALGRRLLITRAQDRGVDQRVLMVHLPIHEPSDAEAVHDSKESTASQSQHCCH